MKSPLLLLALTASAQAFDYMECFDGHADLSPASAAGWNLVTDTDAPQTLGADFAANDDLNVAKITRANDATSLFSSAYFYHEHDIAAGETSADGTLYGQDAGDFLLTPNLTCEPEFCRNLSSWSGSGLETLSVIDQGEGYERVTVREIPSVAQQSRAFTRVSITRTSQ